jgi:hypothetical protein
VNQRKRQLEDDVVGRGATRGRGGHGGVDVQELRRQHCHGRRVPVHRLTAQHKHGGFLPSWGAYVHDDDVHVDAEAAVQPQAVRRVEGGAARNGNDAAQRATREQLCTGALPMPANDVLKVVRDARLQLASVLHARNTAHHSRVRTKLVRGRSRSAHLAIVKLVGVQHARRHQASATPPQQRQRRAHVCLRTPHRQRGRPRLPRQTDGATRDIHTKGPCCTRTPPRSDIGTAEYVRESRVPPYLRVGRSTTANSSAIARLRHDVAARR